MCEAEEKLEKLEVDYFDLKTKYELLQQRYENTVVYYKQELTSDKEYSEIRRNPENQFGIIAKEFWKTTKAFDLTQVNWLKGVYNRHTIIHVINHMQILDDDFRIGQLGSLIVFKNDNEIGVLCPLGLHEDNQKELDEVWELIRQHKAKIVVILNKEDPKRPNSQENCDRGFQIEYSESSKAYVKQFWAKTEKWYCVVDGTSRNCEDCKHYCSQDNHLHLRCFAEDIIVKKEEIEELWLQIPIIGIEKTSEFKILTLDCSDQLV